MNISKKKCLFPYPLILVVNPFVGSIFISSCVWRGGFLQHQGLNLLKSLARCVLKLKLSLSDHQLKISHSQIS